MGGEQDHRQRGVLAADVLEQGEAVAIGQADVTEHEVEALDPQQRARALDAIGGRHPVAAGLQAHRQQAQQIAVVIDQQHVRTRGGAGGRQDHRGFSRTRRAAAVQAARGDSGGARFR